MNAPNWLYWSTGVLVFVFLAFALIINHADSHPYALLALLGLATCFLSRPRAFSPQEKALFILLGIVVFISLLSWLINDGSQWGWERVNRHARLLMAIPIICLLIRVRLPQGWLWYGVAAGAILAGVFGLIEAWYARFPNYRVEGAVDPITFGNWSLIMGFMALAGFGWFRERSGGQAIIPVLAAVLGMTASVLSETRSGWVALPALALLFFWFFWPSLKRGQHGLLLSLIAIGSIAMFAIPQTGVQKRIDTAVRQVDACMEDGQCISSVGMRLLIWGSAWDLFLERPILGTGQHAFKEEVRQEVERGAFDEKMLLFGEPHNEYLYTLSSRGVIGFAVLLALLLGIGWIFLRAARSPMPDLARVGLAGLVLIVATVAIGLTISVFYRSRDLNFYGFLFALLVYHTAALSVSSTDE